MFPRLVREYTRPATWQTRRTGAGRVSGETRGRSVRCSPDPQRLTSPVNGRGLLQASSLRRPLHWKPLRSDQRVPVVATQVRSVHPIEIAWRLIGDLQ